MADLPDYYGILEVAPSADADAIKRAYKRAALKWHPDRVPTDSPERPKRTKRFQAINDAYYTLSDTTRRKEYDEARAFHTGSTFTFGDEADEDIPRPPPQAGGSFFSNFFGGAGRPSAPGSTQEERFADQQFEGIFAEMMGEADAQDTENHPQTQKRGPFWSVLGAMSGATLGFIIANFPGMFTGAVTGAKLGDLRDKKGQSVYQTFQQLPQNDKAKLLSELAARLFAGAIS